MAINTTPVLFTVEQVDGDVDLVEVLVREPIIEVEVQVPGAQGIPGPVGPEGSPGKQGPAGGSLYIAISDVPIGGQRVIVLDDDGFAKYASCQDLTHANKVIGVTTGAANAGDDISTVVSGDVYEPSWSWTLGQPLYLGDNGLLTQVQPEAPALFSLIVGFPITPTKLFVSIREPIIF